MALTTARKFVVRESPEELSKKIIEQIEIDVEPPQVEIEDLENAQRIRITGE
jgi:hypothetical protein